MKASSDNHAGTKGTKEACQGGKTNGGEIMKLELISEKRVHGIAARIAKRVPRQRQQIVYDTARETVYAVLEELGIAKIIEALLDTEVNLVQVPSNWIRKRLEVLMPSADNVQLSEQEEEP